MAAEAHEVDTVAARYIRLRWAGSCRQCGRDLPAGVSAWHDKSTRSVTCASCVTAHVHADLGIALAEPPDTTPQPPAASNRGVAGAGARAKYERLRASREAHARDRFGTLGVIAAGLSGDPQHVAAWKTGAEGEERLAARLSKLLRGTNVVLLHDCRIPMSLANIDHLAVGPGGVTVVDAKNYKGKVRVERTGGLFRPRVSTLRVAGRDRTKLIEGVKHQMTEVRSALRDSGRPDVPVAGALCFVNTDGLPLLGHLQVDDVEVHGPRGAAKLAGRPGPLNEPDIAETVEHLAVRLPAAPTG